MNEDDLRYLFENAARPALDDEVRALSALYAGRRHRRSQRLQRVTATAASLAVVATGALALQVRAAAPAAADALVACAAGAPGRAGTATGGLDGVTLTVENPTSTVATVTAHGVTALALPGTTHVTLPLASGEQVRCGDGAPVSVNVTEAASRPCAFSQPARQEGLALAPLDALTRAQLRGLPADVTVTAGPPTGPLHRVRVVAAGRLVAEAVWHEMPDGTSWHLESLHNCA